jgi:8-amino-7-oxononanoate synthase
MSGEKFEFLAEKLDAIRDADALRSLRPRVHDGSSIIEPDGTRLINFGSNDYLGLATSRWPLDPTSTVTSLATAPFVACGAGASALVSGFTTLHQQLCQQLADLEQTDAAVVFPSGYAACSGVIATLAEDGDMLLSDELNHASLIDGCRLSRATRFVFPHLDVDSLRESLEQHRHRFNRAWIVTDGVFGMDGDVAPLDALCDLADRFDAHLIVDEAHATGVLGVDGSGSCAELGVKSRVAIRIGTLSKAIGSHGGFVVGPQLVIDYLVNRCRSLIFSTAGSPLTIAAAIRGVETIRNEPQRRLRVRTLAERFRAQVNLRQSGKVPKTSISGVPIVPIIIGENLRVVQLADKLRQAGFYVPAIRPPTVPPNTARLRVCLSAGHLEEEIDRLAMALS